MTLATTSTLTYDAMPIFDETVVKLRVPIMYLVFINELKQATKIREMLI